MVIIDAVYLTLALVLAAYCFLAVYLRQRYPAHRHLTWMIAGIGIMATTMIFVAFAPVTRQTLAVATLMYFASAAVTAQVFVVLTTQARRHCAMLLPAALLIGVSITATLAGIPYMKAAVSMHIACSLLLAEAAWRIGGFGKRSLIDRTISGCIWVMATIFLFRGLGSFLFFGSETSFEILKRSRFEIAILLAMAVPGMSMTLLMFFRTLDETANHFREVSQTDALTGLLNRNALLDAAAHITNGTFLIVCDIDHFKRVNDTWGHAAGDMALVCLGRLFRGMNMVAARIGGEEFALLISRASPEQARLAAEGLRTAFSLQEIEGMPETERLTASFGISAYQAGDNFNRLFKRADAALYEAKATGRNKVVVAPAIAAMNVMIAA
jgi:diguanylate cyclase (GGDEF)-like protein